MGPVLQIVLVVLAVLLTAFLAPLLLQLYRTARAVQNLAESARLDLRQIAEDVHQGRLQLEKVSGLVEKSLEFPATASSMAAAAARTMGTLLGGKAPVWVQALVTVLKLVLDYFGRPQRADGPEKETHHE